MERRDGAEPSDDLLGVIEPAHVGIRGGEIAIRHGVALVLLDREDEIGHGLIEAPTEEMRHPYEAPPMAELHAGAQELSYLQMLDRNFWVTRPQPKITTLVPARSVIRVQRQ